MEGKGKFVFPVVIAAVIVFVVSGAVTFFNVGWRSDFVIRWWSAFAIGWPIAAGTAYLAMPFARRLTRRIVTAIERTPDSLYHVEGGDARPGHTTILAGNVMRNVLPAITAIVFATPAMAQDPGISSSVVSRCAGKVGTDTRRVDPAFGIIMLDGRPWTTIEHTEEKFGATTVTGTGALRRRDGTLERFRFTCGLDAHGQALMFHASQLLSWSGASIPATAVVAGSAAYPWKMALPRGAELRVQPLDIGKSSAGTVLTEQVVRSGWRVPIPFALHLSKDTPLEGRKLVVTARLVVGHRTLFQLAEPHVIAGEDLHKPIELVLD